MQQFLTDVLTWVNLEDFLWFTNGNKEKIWGFGYKIIDAQLNFRHNMVITLLKNIKFPSFSGCTCPYA